MKKICLIVPEIWLAMIIDGHPVLAEYIKEVVEEEVLKESLELESNQIREYCCRPFRSSYLKIVKERLLPPLIAIIRRTIRKLKWVQRDVDAHYLFLSENLAFKAQLGVTALKNLPKLTPYDYSCPAIQDVINRRLCSVCSLYLASIKEMSSISVFYQNSEEHRLKQISKKIF